MPQPGVGRPSPRLSAASRFGALCCLGLSLSVGTPLAAAQPAQLTSPAPTQSAQLTPGSSLPLGLQDPDPRFASIVEPLLPPVQHPGAPTPRPFPAEAYGWYRSDVSSYVGGVYAEVLDAYPRLAQQHPEVLRSNLDQVVAINQQAVGNEALVRRAQRDARTSDEGVLDAFSDAFGQRLGEAFRQALREHRLPKTQLLFGGRLARAGGLASSMSLEKQIFQKDRPFVVAPERIHRFEVEGQKIYPSSKAFPSGHTNQATWTTTLLATLLPELAPQLLARGSEAGYHRLVLGVHYPMDVMAGRMTGMAAAADRWNDPVMRQRLKEAASEIRAELEWRCGSTLADCVAQDAAYSAHPVADYTARMSYGFEPIGRTDRPMIVPQAAPDLLLGRFPTLSYRQRAQILAATASGSGMPLDRNDPRGSWERINLAAAMTADIRIEGTGPDAPVRVIGHGA